jgi:hypothetical protein
VHDEDGGDGVVAALGFNNLEGHALANKKGGTKGQDAVAAIEPPCHSGHFKAGF